MPTHFTLVADGAADDAATINDPLTELDDALVKTLNGTYSHTTFGATGTATLAKAVLTKLLMAASSTLTIATGAVTATQSYHLVDTEGGAASDDLDTITIPDAVMFLVISSVSAAHVVTIRHGVGNVYTSSGANIVLDTPNKAVILLRVGSNVIEVSGTELLKLSTMTDTTQNRVREIVLPTGSMRVPSGSSNKQIAMLRPNYEARNSFGVRASGAGIIGVGVTTPTAANVPTNANDTTNTFTNLPSTAVAGNIAGFPSPTFNLVRRQYNPEFSILIKTPSDITSLRYWIGLISADVTNVDTLAAGTRFIGFRFSTAVPDTGWRPITNDGTTQNTGSNIGTVTADTVYLLKFRVDDTNGIVYFSVNNGTEVTLNSNLPAATQDLGFICRVIPVGAAIRTLNFSWMEVEYA